MAGKTMVSPQGKLKWAHIFVADTKFKTEGQFHTKLEVPIEEATELRESVDRVYDNWKKEIFASKGQKNYREFLPYQVVSNDEGIETDIAFHFKMRASGVNKKTGNTYTQRPFVIGPNKEPITSVANHFGNGSVAKIAYEFFPYEFGASIGVQLRLRGIQVLSVVAYDAQQNDDVFAVEEGYAPVTQQDTESELTKEEIEVANTDVFKETTEENGDF
jgi:hypothetical protein